MGRNIFSVCHECQVQLMHLRGKQNINMMRFQVDHKDHEKMTEILCDYAQEPPADYEDVFDKYNPSPTKPGVAESEG
jgi:hypothetical protein